MQTVVIIGAGDVGSYIAELLSKAEHSVVVIDLDKKKLEELSWRIDVATRLGSGTDWQLLDELMELAPSLLLALTNDDEANFVACSIAKHLGYPLAIARVRDSRYLNRTRLDFARMFDVDHFIGPEVLVAQDMMKYMVSYGALIVENFAHGAVQLRTLILGHQWKKESKALRELDLPEGIMVGLIKRGDEVIFPHGDNHLQVGDEVTFIGETESMDDLNAYLSFEERSVKSVVIIGGSLVGINLARFLEKKDVAVRLIEENYEKCALLADLLTRTTIMNHDATDIDFLKEEKIGEADVVLFCTRHDEINLLGALLAKEVGAKDVVVMLCNPSYKTLVGELGINHVASPRTSAGNRILSQILSGTLNSLISLYDNRAEVIEIKVSMDASVVGIPLSELGPFLPKDFLITMIQNRGRIMVANGTRIISPGDTVIVMTDPKHISELEKIF